jgi:hypothetical protein
LAFLVAKLDFINIRLEQLDNRADFATLQSTLRYILN